MYNDQAQEAILEILEDGPMEWMQIGDQLCIRGFDEAQEEGFVRANVIHLVWRRRVELDPDSHPEPVFRLHQKEEA